MEQKIIDEICGAAGVILSLACSYIPGVRERFEALDPTRKRLVMLGLLALAATGAFLLANLDGGSVPALQAGLVWMRAFVLAMIANQAAFTISPRPER